MKAYGVDEDYVDMVLEHTAQARNSIVEEAFYDHMEKEFDGIATC